MRGVQLASSRCWLTLMAILEKVSTTKATGSGLARCMSMTSCKLEWICRSKYSVNGLMPSQPPHHRSSVPVWPIRPLSAANLTTASGVASSSRLCCVCWSASAGLEPARWRRRSIDGNISSLKPTNTLRRYGHTALLFREPRSDSNGLSVATLAKSRHSCHSWSSVCLNSGSSKSRTLTHIFSKRLSSGDGSSFQAWLESTITTQRKLGWTSHCLERDPMARRQNLPPATPSV